MSEQPKPKLFGGYPLYKDRFPNEQPTYQIDAVMPPKTFDEAIDQIVYAALPDVDAYKSTPAYQRELIWCAAAWLLVQDQSEPLAPEKAMEEYLDFDRARTNLARGLDLPAVTE